MIEKIPVIAVPSVEEARKTLLSSGLFEACPGLDDLVIHKANGVKIRLVKIPDGN